MKRRPPRSTRKESSAASDVYKRQLYYYLMVIRQMYLYEPEDGTEQWKLSVTGYVTTLALFVSLVVFGLWGTPLYAAAYAAASGMF